MDKKEISAKTTVRALITGFVSYGIITIFICLLILALGNTLLKNVSSQSAKSLYIIFPLMAIIILYFIIHGLCQLSTYDLFRKCKTKIENYKTINKFMTIFYISCIVICIFIFTSLLFLNLQYQLKSIEYAQYKYKEVFSDEHIELLTQEMNNAYNESKNNLTISTVLLDLGVSISLLSLISYQRKMIVKYNEK